MSTYIQYDGNGAILTQATYNQEFTPDAEEGKTWLALSEPIDINAYRVVEGVVTPYSESEQAAKDAFPGYGFSWNAADCEWEDNRTTDEAADIVRAERARLLQASDWTQLGDIDAGVKARYASYRQALRDIPEQEGFPFTVTWPELP